MPRTMPILSPPRLLAAAALTAATTTLGVAAAEPLLMEAPAGSAAAEAQRPVGVVRPSREVVLKAPVPGVLATLAVEEGQTVAEGDELARIDDAVQAARVAAARVRAAATAEADGLAASAQAARRELGRTREAAATGAAPAWELEASETALTVAEARHAEALQRVELAAAELAVEVAAGASLTPADPVLRLATLDPLEATVYVPASLFGRLGPDRVGAVARLHPTLPGTPTLDAVLTASLPEIDPGSRSFRCVFRIENPGSRLPAGFTVGLEVPGELD